jgi:hypothetical protein
MIEGSADSGGVSSRASQQHGGTALFFFQEAEEQVARLQVRHTLSAALALSGSQGAGDGRSHIGEHRSGT